MLVASGDARHGFLYHWLAYPRADCAQCDSQIPCGACLKREILCSYSQDDRRRSQYRQGTSIRHTSTPTNVGDNVGNLTKPSILGKDADHDEFQEDGLVQQVGAGRPQSGAAQHTQTKSLRLLAPGRDLGSRLPVPHEKTSEELRGRFRVHLNRPSDKQDTGSASKSVSVTKNNTTGHKQFRHADEHGQRVELCHGVRRRFYPVPGYTRTFGNLPFSSSIKTNGYPFSVQMRQTQNFSTPQYLVPPLVELDESPLGRALTDFKRLGQRLIAKGALPSQIADQGSVDVSLYFRDRQPEDPFNASTWAAEMLRAFKGTFPDELLLACAVCVAKLMRWLILPTPDNYADIPSMMRPTDLQRMRPHAPWIDLMIFPSFRDALTQRPRDWTGPCMNAEWSLHWPYPLEEALIRTTESRQIFLAPPFAEYIDDPKHWSMRKCILKEFPEIESSEINILHA